ncbi:MAG: hypothetical protein N2041_00005, partial [Tepidiforma sp.]
LLDRGSPAAAGVPREVLDAAVLGRVYGLDARVRGDGEGSLRIDFRLRGEMDPGRRTTEAR